MSADKRPFNHYTGTVGVNAGDAILTVTQQDAQHYNRFLIQDTVAAVDVVVKATPGSAWSSPVAITDLHVEPVIGVVAGAVGKCYLLKGKYAGVRVRQSGATPANANLMCYSE